ncbi:MULTISPECIES: hypothetical protein [unclassified Caballeronia]|uniref:hypothetical protein n=1 Tax=unclassified Caballeronia TaxID=2646786 RepID=UPI002028901D|nr:MULTISPECIES: hypothetical protein [unclassified Caballeronia]MDR5768106.1 hypothetical protein [Caballeronia sp. LZ028]
MTIVDIVAGLDESSATGNYPIVPSTIVWMLEMTTPVLFLRINDEGLLPTLTELVKSYAELRSRAQAHQALSAYSHAGEVSLPGYTATAYRLTFDDLESTLSEAPQSATLLFNDLFSEVAPATRRRLAQMDALDWDGFSPEPITDHSLVGERENFHREEYEYYRYFVEPYQGDDPVTDVVDSMMRHLMDGDTGRRQDYWSRVAAPRVVSAASHDFPILTEKVRQQGRISELTEKLERNIGALREAEQVWQALGAPLRVLLAIHASSLKAKEIIRDAIKASASLASPCGLDSEVYWMFCRRLTFAAEQHVPPQICWDSNPVLDAIRRDPAALQTCYIGRITHVACVDPYQSPSERCLIVRLPEIMLQLMENLAEDRGIERFFSRSSESEELHLHLTPNRAFWVAESKLLPHLYKFTNRLTVVYVFDACSVVMHYAFNPFIDLQEKLDMKGRDLPSLTIECGEWRYAANFYASRLPDGTQVKPALLNEVRELAAH